MIEFISDATDGNGLRFNLRYHTLATCEEGWKEFGSHCYFFSEDEMDFEGAREDCEAKNSQLTSIHSREEQLFIQERVKTPTAWIGAVPTASLLADPFNFEFIDGTPNDYHNLWPWERISFGACGEPEDCAIGLVPDRWVNRDCSEERPVICESFYEEESGGGWSWGCLTGDCVRVSNQSFEFDAADSYCLQIPEWHVLSIGRAEEEQFAVAERFEGFGLPHPLPKWREFWVGLRREASGEWEWIDGNVFLVDRWEEGYPTENGGNCTVMTTSSWDDMQLYYQASYVCKKLL